MKKMFVFFIAALFLLSSVAFGSVQQEKNKNQKKTQKVIVTQSKDSTKTVKEVKKENSKCSACPSKSTCGSKEKK